VAKFLCVCGAVIHTSGTIPNESEWLYISATDYDAFTGQVDAETLHRAFGSAFVCPVSGHIWVFKDGFGADPTGYAPLPPGARSEEAT
jgi:hypothetical protein